MTKWNSLCLKTEVLYAYGLTQTTAWKLGNMSYSKLKTCLLGNCMGKETKNCKRLRLDWGQRFEIRFLSHGDSEFVVCPTLVTRRKDIFLYFFTELKTYHLSYSIWKLFIFYITWIFGGCMLKILGGHFVSTSSTARKTIETVLMKL